MGNGLFWAIGASVIVSLISLIGILSLLLKEGFLHKVLILLIGFSAGGLIGGAFLHLLPEALAETGDVYRVFFYTILGFTLFFYLERYLHWRHCHDKNCDIHSFTYLNLIGDGAHNFADGLVIGASFLANINLGLATTLAIVTHEIPQEISDFGILIYGGFSKAKALLYNFISAATAIVGTIIGYHFAESITGFSNVILPLSAGGFIYISSCDLIPEIHKQEDIKKSGLSMMAFLLGVLLMYALRCDHAH